MASEEGVRPVTEVVKALRHNRHIADNPSYETIGRVSHMLAARKTLVYGVQVEGIPRSTANDLLRGKRVRGPIKLWQVLSLGATLRWIADQNDQLDADAMIPIPELRRLYYGAEQREPSASAGGKTAARPRHHWPPAGPPPSIGPVEAVPGAPGMSREREQATERLLDDARRRGSDAWWSAYEGVVPEWLAAYLTLEREAQEIRVYAPYRIPELLQTREYARHTIREDMPGLDRKTVARLVKLRMRRQELLRRSDSPEYWAVVNVRALQRGTVPPDVLRAQLKHLLTMANFRNIEVQFIKDEAARDVICPRPITIMRFAEGGYLDMVFVQHPDHGIYHYRNTDVAYFSLCHGTLAVRAIQPFEMVRTLLKALDRL
ncbi:DUF5753 domain-containing protein [Spirillospora sp. NPDC047279]|uniref:DUF5753 domain-containing protein n=1 Tax=Spirillospora sp. NPDC047279 TaxID=3155478 RepID=UPI00340174C6